MARPMDAILIAGPTASGKSALAMQLAERHDGVVVNADSMQVYEELHVLTARPSADDVASISHRLYGHISARDTYSTGKWYTEAESVCRGIWGDGRIPVFVGGTGLYFRALLGGLSPMPAIPDPVRRYWRERLEADGAGPLHAVLQVRDPATARTLQPADGQRIVRALEVFETTGLSIDTFRKTPGKPLVGPERLEKIVVMPERRLHAAAIETRFDAMLENGAVEEVRALYDLGLPSGCTAMKAIGVKQIAAMLSGEISMARAREMATAATRQYAKRQATWFRNQLDTTWLTVSGAGKAPQDGPAVSGR